MHFEVADELLDAVLIDEGLMRQMFTNLVQNALNALSEAKIKKPVIKVSLTNDGDELCLTIIDNARFSRC